MKNLTSLFTFISCMFLFSCNSSEDPIVDALEGDDTQAELEAYTFGDDDMFLDIGEHEFDVFLAPKDEYATSVGDATQCTIVGAWSYDEELFGMPDVDPWMPLEITSDGSSMDFGWVTAEVIESEQHIKGLRIKVESNMGHGRYVKLKLLCNKQGNKEYVATLAVKQAVAGGWVTGPQNGFNLTCDSKIPAEGGKVYIEVSPLDFYIKTVDDPNLWETKIVDTDINWATAEGVDDNGTPRVVVTARPNTTGKSRTVKVMVSRNWFVGEERLGMMVYTLFADVITLTQQ